MQSCVHRDLKLENILFDRNENVKLVDFGFTREYEGKASHLQTFCGTICYSAPEMLKGERYAGEKVDVWSLGVILYALLCGELPFDDDDDNVTRKKILTEDPKFPEHLPADAVALIKLLLSKRPILRPPLSDILAHPFLAEHAPAQRAILDIQPTAPFSLPIEKDTLQRMRSAGVDIDAVIESVLSQRCDALAGWWTLLNEKETRKARRRERKRREKEAELRSLRRLSAASSRLERMTPTLQDVSEEGGGGAEFRVGETSRARGRSERRSAHYYDFRAPPDLPQLSEAQRGVGGAAAALDGEEAPPPPVDKDSVRSVSTSRTRRPVPPPKEGVIRSARSRGSTLHLVTTSDALGEAEDGGAAEPAQKVRKKPSQAIAAHWRHWTHWIFETTRRGRIHNRRGSQSTPDLRKERRAGGGGGEGESARPATGRYNGPGGGGSATAGLPAGLVANGGAKAGLPIASSMAAGGGGPGSGSGGLGPGPGAGNGSPGLSAGNIPPRISSSQSYKRQSLSPSAPLTPRTAMRRSSGLRGRKSTSSSVSSVRSVHRHRHSHSKASSTSSGASVSTAVSKGGTIGASPHRSVKVLPASPAPGIPSDIRLVRGPGSPAPLRIPGDEARPQQPGSPNPFSGGSVMFAKRKRNLFKGPMVGGGRGSGSHSRSGSGGVRGEGEMAIQEVDEGDEVDDGFEEVR